MHTMTRHSLPRWLPLILLATTLCWTGQPVYAESAAPHADEHGEEQGEEHGEEEEKGEEGHIAMTPDQIKYGEISLDHVGPATIRETLPLYGQIVPNAEREHSVAARFPGVIRKVTKQVGDPVKEGETLATVESNESLKPYSVVASLTGVVAQRNANIGEQTGDRMLFVIGDYSTVWVDLSVFPADLSKVHVGQQVRITNSDASATGDGKIITVSPVGSSTNQTTTARVLLDNADRRWVPGHFVNAALVLSETAVPLTIRDEAVQVVDGKSVVFVANSEGFEARPVTLGRGDGQVREVFSGLKAGESYVAANSFVLKSEMGKEGAEHGH
jgi:cobalt-zinc-cadmium efflux system membrane fusion protein